MKRYLFLFAFIFFLTGCQSSDIGDLKPPEPTITVDNQEISYTMGTYSWSENGKAVNADSASPPELVEEVNEVSSGETISIDFDYEPTSIEIGIWANNGADFKGLDSNQIVLPNEKGEFIYVIHASWAEGDGIYALSIRTK
ncbi:lipoprotein [Ornithinibacillus salinisoli]|uniref:Lipoprotein n=1 Tax=Ornithinibacillus salinisoli TaxID=1848459 RepID=A0ABW4VUR0_9BACI